MSTETVAARMGATAEAALALEEAVIRYGIVTTLAKAHWLAQLFVESAGFKRVRENMHYSPARLAQVWPARYAINPLADPTQRRPNALALRIGGSAEAIANHTYGGRMGNVEPGDGWKFIGRGFKQVTGRYNYGQCSQALYGDDTLLREPERLERLPDAALSAGWYWESRNLNAAAMRDDLEAVTRGVNGGLNGLADRRRALEQAKRHFAEITHA